MRLEFESSDRTGGVVVDVRPNEYPLAGGCPEFARGFPICRATVEPDARGYNDILGWIQVVGSTNHGEGFRIDPFEPIDTEPNHPFCFYGFAPTLLDLPHREQLEDIDWVAHSFICDLGDEPLSPPREIRCLLGFSWGFTVRDGDIKVIEAELLDSGAWDDHLPYLRGAFPRWDFVPSRA